MNIIEIENLSKQRGDFKLKSLNLSLPSGCILGLVGENGAGKSTTIKLILNMIKKDSGTIRIFGRDNTENTKILKEDLGIVLDENGFPNCVNSNQVNKIMKNIYRNWDEAKFSSLVKQLEIPENKSFGDYSKGMKMKLGIAIAMSHNAKLLILDEATSGLDPVVRDEVLEMFNEFTRDERHAVIISSHVVSDLEKVCDYIAFLHKGELILCKEKDELLAEYCVVNCTKEQFAEIGKSKAIGIKRSAYGVEAIVKRIDVPVGFDYSPVSIEDLFIFMAKGETK